MQFWRAMQFGLRFIRGSWANHQVQFHFGRLCLLLIYYELFPFIFYIPLLELPWESPKRRRFSSSHLQYSSVWWRRWILSLSITLRSALKLGYWQAMFKLHRKYPCKNGRKARRRFYRSKTIKNSLKKHPPSLQHLPIKILLSLIHSKKLAQNVCYKQHKPHRPIIDS